jgi:hypothetical protein
MMDGAGPRRGWTTAALAATAVALVALTPLAACQTAPLDAIGLAPTALGNGLIAHYTFDEGSGTNVADHSGNNHNGVLTGGIWIPGGKFGGALHFDGFSTVAVQPFPNATASFSVSSWIRSPATPFDAGAADATPFETVLSTEFARAGGWELNLEETTPTGIHTAYWDRTAKAYTIEECTCVKANEWTHVVSVLDGGAHTLSLYVNGSLAGSVPAPHPISPGTLGLFMGHWFGPGRFLVGDIDDVAIYSRALELAEVTALESGPPPDPP